MDGCRSDSSGEEDGDGDWRAAIDSVASVISISKPNSHGLQSSVNGHEIYEGGEAENRKRRSIKNYQIKAQKLLEDILEKTVEVVKNAAQSDAIPTLSDDGVRLFKHAPHGIIFDHVDELQGPKKKPKILRSEELDEKSKKFRKQLQSVVVDGADIIRASRVACQKSLVKLKAKEAAATAAAKSEEERVAELKKIRGERWLPSLAREKRVNT